MKMYNLSRFKDTNISKSRGEKFTVTPCRSGLGSWNLRFKTDRAVVEIADESEIEGVIELVDEIKSALECGKWL